MGAGRPSKRYWSLSSTHNWRVKRITITTFGYRNPSSKSRCWWPSVVLTGLGGNKFPPGRPENVLSMTYVNLNYTNHPWTWLYTAVAAMQLKRWFRINVFGLFIRDRITNGSVYKKKEIKNPYNTTRLQIENHSWPITTKRCKIIMLYLRCKILVPIERT